MTSKGQVTIPLALRERYGLDTGADVEVIATADGALVRPAATRSRGAELLAALRDRADAGVDADTVLQLTRSDPPA